MTRQEIKQLMEQGVLYSKNWGVECKVLHLFKHKTWLWYKNRITSIPHKYVNNSRLELGESTFLPTKRLTTGKETEILKELIQHFEKTNNNICNSN